MITQPTVKVALRGLPQSESLLAPIRKAVGRIATEFPGVTSCRMEIEAVDELFEAHVELVLPERQIIVNRVHRSADIALEQALDALKAGLPAAMARAA